MKNVLFSIITLLLGAVVVQAQSNLSPHFAEPKTDYENLRNTILMIEQGVKAHDPRFVQDFFDSAVVYKGNACLNSELEGNLVNFFDYKSKDTAQLRSYYNTFKASIVPVFTIHEANVLRTGENLLIEQDAGFSTVGDTISVELKMLAGHNGVSICTKIVFIRRSIEDWLPSESFVVQEIKDDGLIEALSTYADAYAAFKLGNDGWEQEWSTGITCDVYDFIDGKPRSCVDRVENYKVSYSSLIPVAIEFTIENNSYRYWNINRSIAINGFNEPLLGSIDNIYIQEGPTNTHSLFITDRTFNRVFIGDFAASKFLTQPWYDNGYSGHVYSQLAEMHRYPDENQFVAYDCGAGRFDHFYYNPYPTTYGLHSMGTHRLIPNGVSLKEFFPNTSPTDSGYKSTMWISYSDTSHPGLMQYFVPTQYFVPQKVFRGMELKCGDDLISQNFSSPPRFAMMEHFGRQYGIWAAQRVLLNAGASVYISDMLDDVFDNAIDTTVFPVLYSSELCDPSYRSPNLSMVDNLSSGKFIVSDRSNGLVHLFDTYRGKYICSYANTDGAFYDFVGMRHVKADYGAYAANSQQVRKNYDLYTVQDWSNGAGLKRYLESVEALTPNIELYDPVNNGVMEVSLVLTGSARLDCYTVENGQKYYWYRDMICDARKILLSVECGADTLVVEYVPEGNPSYGEYAAQVRKILFLADSTVQIQRRAEPVPNVPLLRCYPQPASSMLTIEYESADDDVVNISLHNMLGEKLHVIYENWVSAGTHRVAYKLPDLSNGIYFIRMITSNAIVSEKFMHIN